MVESLRRAGRWRADSEVVDAVGVEVGDAERGAEATSDRRGIGHVGAGRQRDVRERGDAAAASREGPSAEDDVDLAAHISYGLNSNGVWSYSYAVSLTGRRPRRTCQSGPK